MISENIARYGLPSQLGPVSARPVVTSAQLTTLKAGSRIHCQAMVDSTVGTMNGSSRSARQVLEAEVLVHHQGKPQTSHHLQECRGDGVDEGVDHHLPEHRIVPIGDEIIEADEH